MENRSGAGGNLGTEFVAASAADGHTLLVTPQAPLVINQYLYTDLRFDPSALVPIVVLGQVPTALLAHPKLPFDNIEQLIVFAAANPGKLKSATQGIGTTSHVTSEMFQMMAHVKFQQVPYRGSAPALQDLAAGNVDIMFDNVGASLALVRDGKLKLIAIATKKRMSLLPAVATIAETLPEFESTSWNAIAGPPGIPRAIASKINVNANEALRDPDVVNRYAANSIEIIGGSLENTAAYFAAERQRWGNVIKNAGVAPIPR